MSVVSNRTSHAALMRASLAKRTSLATSYAKIRESVVKSALSDYFADKNPKPYEDLARTVRDRVFGDEEAVVLLKDCSLCVGAMSRETRLLVETLFALDWNASSPAVVDAFSKWTIDLLTAQIFHTPIAVGSLIKLLSKNDSLWNESPPPNRSLAYSHVHNLIAQIVSVIPMSTDVLIRCAIDNFPYYKSNPAVNQAYVHNLLWITRYIPSLTDEILTLILNRLIILDLNIGNETNNVNTDCVFEMDREDKIDDLTESLDVCMMEVFRWIDQNGPEVLDVLFSVFQRVILPTRSIRNVQFVLLYGLSKNISRLQMYLEVLWQVVPSARVGPAPRQACVSHLTGLLTRASYVSPQCIKTYINKMAEWCHSYIKAQEISSLSNAKNPHAVFYSVCQCLFYLIAFNHKQLFSDKKNLMFVVSLNLPKIVMSSLNPLKVCHEGIADAFASITRIHQIVYCHTIMEQNTRRNLRTDEEKLNYQEWFPYDPYTLPKSVVWIRPIYREYDDVTNENHKHNRNMEICDEDDFLATSPSGFLAKSSFNSLRHINQ